MEPKVLLSSTSRPFAPNGTFPFSISHKSSFLHKTRICPVTHLAISANHFGKTQILGKSLAFGEKNGSLCNLKTPFLGKSVSFREKNESLCNLRKPQVPNFTIRAAGAVKRRKELPFDNVIQRDKKLKLVMKIRKILVSQPDRIMSLRELGRYRRALGLEKKRRFIALLKKFPGVFEIVEEGAYSLKFKMTPEAERLYLEEMKIRYEMEDLLVVKLRKILMMSLDKRILLEKIGHLKTDLGLPLEFQDTICRRYPQYFKVVPTGRGPALELTHWDPELAVSAAQIAEEENRQRELEEKDLIIDRPPRFNRVKLPKGLKLSKGEMRRISQFRDMPYISPYEDFSEIRQGTPEKEKHACGVVHELLSLTVEKRTLVDHLTHFREEFRFSQQLRGMLIRHPDMFYVSLKGDRDSVFLREAYQDSHLIEKNRLLLIKEKLRSLVSVTRFNRRTTPQTDSDGTEKSESKYGTDAEEGEDWSDIDNLGSDGFDDGDEDSDDDWSDDGDEDIPPDFSDDEGTVNLEDRKLTKKVNGTKEEEKNLVPVFPDGRPRERW
ncbi:protein WHAT'S THIS FACTOR 1 homolog, chloroplastic [Lycium barbarum]|uniref:protein WHAT'S THIS FACTOR 1 homolog, chloroplastic n=1 Tax=Lycium barbarum TaxID=112863 RepID=UPI00293F19B4|nr:protein WHAT'S THIS FACTOR 1 homolog, chloroplastic [Lycium barbarum]